MNKNKVYVKTVIFDIRYILRYHCLRYQGLTVVQGPFVQN